MKEASYAFGRRMRASPGFESRKSRLHRDTTLHRRVGALRVGRFLCATVPVSLAGLAGLGHESAGAAIAM
jgi:hypothetical protein